MDVGESELKGSDFGTLIQINSVMFIITCIAISLNLQFLGLNETLYFSVVVSFINFKIKRQATHKQMGIDQANSLSSISRM